VEETVVISRAEPRHAAGLAALFGSNGYGCHCRFWHFQGTAREWLARCAHEPETNQRECEAALLAGSPEMSGFVAETATSTLVGWLKLAPATSLAKLYEQRLYKGLPCFGQDRSGVFTIGCLLVREDFRHRGIARALLGRAVELAPSLGARALEAFPRSDADVADAALMLGPLRLFQDAGFEIVHDFYPYPVLRRTFAETEPGAAP
jgi:GNAT superfamily N-acetyltransferase